MRITLLAIVACLAACYKPDFGNGALQCTTDGKCPSGYHCDVDQRCWKGNSHPPAVARNPHAGGATVSGVVSAQSTNYRVVMTTAAGNGGAASTNNKLRAGVIGATQESK